ncbi:hypothetical protein QJS66_02515 [Kocuria rhizophila]|nr:hypothetical protein QJS66_02515 [Kocuria rhizophila]
MPALTSNKARGLPRGQARPSVGDVESVGRQPVQYRDRATLLAGGVVEALTAQQTSLGLTSSANSQSVHRQLPA